MILQGVLYTKQILPVSTFMELNGFLIGSAIKYIWTFKVDTPIAGHPVVPTYLHSFDHGPRQTKKKTPIQPRRTMKEQ